MKQDAHDYFIFQNKNKDNLYNYKIFK